MITKTNRKMERARRHARVRRKISGTAERPRLCVYRSNSNIYVQIIDDVAGNTLVSCSTLDKDIKTKHANKEAATEVGTMIAKKALEKNKLVPVIEPSVDVTGISDTNVIFEFTIITKPEVTLGEYKNLKVKKEKAVVTDEEVLHEIEHMRSHMADVVVKENGEVAVGDTAVISFTGVVDGKEIEGGKGENYPLEIGSHSFIPGFEEGVVGMKVGETKDLKLKFPENYVEDLKGKEVTFTVTVNEVKMRVLPEMNKEFFEDLGYEDVTDEAGLKAKVKEELTHQKEHKLEDLFMDKVLEAAAKNMKVEINPEIIDDEVHRMINQYAEQLKMQGMDFNEFMKMTGTKEEDLHKQMEPEAEKRVKYRFMLEKVAEVENISFTKEEIDNKANEMATSYGVTKEELLKAFGSLEVVEYDMKMHKALEILKENN